MSSPSDSSSTSTNHIHINHNSNVRVAVNNYNGICPCNGGDKVDSDKDTASATNKNDIATPSTTQAAPVDDADADAADTTSKSVPKAVAKETKVKVMSAEEGAVKYPPVTNSAQALILPKEIVPDTRAKVNDDHVTKFVHLLPFLDQTYEKYKGKTVEATRQAKDALIKFLLDLMNLVKNVGSETVRVRVVDNFKTLADERGRKEPCLAYDDVKSFISNSLEEMKKNPFYVLQICNDHAYHLTKAHSSFLETELPEAIIGLGERQPMKWTISKDSAAQHSLVVWANKCCGDTLRQLNDVQERAYGTRTMFRKPGVKSDKKDDKKDECFYTPINYGRRKVYLQSIKKAIPGLKDEASTPDQEKMKKILISHYNDEKKETSEHPPSEDKAKAEESSEHSLSEDHAKATSERSQSDDEAIATSDHQNLNELMRECLKSAADYGKKLNMDSKAILNELYRVLNLEGLWFVGVDDNDGGEIDDTDGREIDDTDEYNGNVAIMNQDEIGSWKSLIKGPINSESFDDSSACGVPLQEIETVDSLKNDQQKESSQEPSMKPNYDPNNGSGASGVPPQIFETPDSLMNDQQKESSHEPSKKQNYDPNNPLQSNNPQDPSTETNQPTQPKPTTEEATNPVLPLGSYEVVKLHAHKKGKKKAGKYYVEWKEEFEGQWGPDRYQWVDANKIHQEIKNDFRRDYKEMDSTVRESLMT